METAPPPAAAGAPAPTTLPADVDAMRASLNKLLASGDGDGGGPDGGPPPAPAMPPPTFVAAPPATANVGATPRREDARTITHSARLMAARRAVESSQPNPIFVDSLAAPLAGPEAVAAAHARQPWLATFPQQPHDGRLPVAFLGVRTRWFDDVLLDAAAGWTGRAVVRMVADDAANTVAVSVTPEPCPPVTQVVSLGAGLDARPWRLPLPGVAWFDVDGAEVVAEKTRALAELGAELWGGAQQPASSSPPAYPLTVKAYSLTVADLTQRGWAAALLAAGWDPAAPSAVVAEGLTYYIGPAGVDAVCKEAAAACPPGSFFLADVMNVRGLERVRTRPGAVLEATWCYGCDVDPGPEYAARGWAVQWVADLWQEARRIQQGHAWSGRAPVLRFGFEVGDAGVEPPDTATRMILARRAG